MASMAMLTIPDAAKVLGLSTQTIRRRIRAGAIESRKVYGPRGMTYRVMLPNEMVAEHNDVPDHVAAALVRSLSSLRAARLQITLLEQEREILEAEVKHLEADLADERAESIRVKQTQEQDLTIHPKIRARWHQPVASKA